MNYGISLVNTFTSGDASDLLDDDKNGCTGARKIVVADFNGDKKPDAFFACHGYDESPWPGDKQVWLYSQPNGKYKKVISDFTTYSHGATAADFNGDGFADIIITDTSGDFGTVKYLKNNRNETFTVTSEHLPSALQSKQAIYSLEFVDINADGKYDLFAAGIDDLFVPSIFINNGKLSDQKILLPRSKFVTLDILIDSDVITLLKSDYIDPNYHLINFNLKDNVQMPTTFVKANNVPWIIKDSKLGVVTLAPKHF